LSWFLQGTPMTNPAETCSLTRAIARNLNSIHLDSFLAPINIVPRHCTSTVNKLTIKLHLNYTLSTLYRDAHGFGQLCTRMAKTTPYPPCTGTALWPTGAALWRCLRRVTQPPHIAGPLGFKTHAILILAPRQICYRLTIPNTTKLFRNLTAASEYFI
jgi:hypothetical protein